ncbi:50S ribosomal protein L10 [Polynucleobacter sp. MWH-S4W17]|nr:MULTISPECIES: 50S ribosomal protein L10 [unclassified Polynucleobacter]MBU3547567.1 50S ribosomal protein L10 [Polynucleobacter sp. P1-05-14]MBU3638254.1 50S ribosomal protein L10 [Polynucleobacter sp. AP-RePozz3-80-G7]MEA9602753.1 50S ribosomal protein L10 [Polynucleobacter sp. MG-28-Ekke-A2]QWD81661.1 50S ribosomal protein L10 [Polynucleobacter sp. MWH-S4W17]
MPLNVQDKKAIVADVGAQLAGAQTVVLAEYRGIPVEQLTKLRASARDQGVYLRVLKNTLARRAAQGTQFEPLADSMVGPLIYGISADPIASAKVLQNFAKTQDKLVITAGLYNGKLLDVAGVKSLASIPSRDELLSQLLGVMLAPVSAMARVLGAVAAQKAEGAPAPVAAPVAEVVAAPAEVVAEAAAPEASAEPAAAAPEAGTETPETPAAE